MKVVFWFKFGICEFDLVVNGFLLWVLNNIGFDIWFMMYDYRLLNVMWLCMIVSCWESFWWLFFFDLILIGIMILLKRWMFFDIFVINVNFWCGGFWLVIVWIIGYSFMVVVMWVWVCRFIFKMRWNICFVFSWSIYMC